MAEQSFEEKTEAPSQRRRQEARERGQVARSTDLSAAVVLLGAMVLLHVFGRGMLADLVELMKLFLGSSQLALDRSGEPWALMALGGKTALLLLVPMLGLLLLAALASTLIQTGFVWSGHPLMPKWEKISPLAGTKRLFSRRALVRLGMSLGKVAIIALVGYFSLVQELPRLVNMTQLDFVAILALAAEMVFTLGLRIGIVLLLLAFADYIFTRWQHEADMRMSKQEVREELRRMEGDPVTRDRRRRVARQLANQRVSREVSGANVIVTNPTHMAVALKYDRQEMIAPIVVAKGAEYMAERIRQLAISHGVPIVQRPSLARSLYRQVEIGQPIPLELYQAVAEVLAYVYEISNRRAALA